MNGGMANGTEKIIRLIWLKLANQWPILQLVAFQMLGDSYVHQVLDINIFLLFTSTTYSHKTAAQILPITVHEGTRSPPVKQKIAT